MMNILKKNRYILSLLLLLLLIIFYTPFMNILANINKYTHEESGYLITENRLLKSENSDLKREIESISKLEPYAKYNYSLTRLSYRELYNDSIITILGGEDKDYHIGNAVINENGLVGIITEVSTHYSKVKIIKNIKDFSVKINNSYGSISKYIDNLLLVENVSNYEDIHLNDEVYTSTLGGIHESLYIGYVYKIEDEKINKNIYIKSNVDFNNLSYMYVVGD